MDTLPLEIIMHIVGDDKLTGYMLSRCCAAWYWIGHECRCAAPCLSVCSAPRTISVRDATYAADSPLYIGILRRLLLFCNKNIYADIFGAGLSHDSLPMLEAVYALDADGVRDYENRMARRCSVATECHAVDCTWDTGPAAAAWMLDRGFDADIAMKCSLRHGRIETVRLLVSRGYVIGEIDVRAMRSIECLDYLLPLGRINLRDMYAYSIKHGLFDAMRYLNAAGYTPPECAVEYAVAKGHLDAIKVLVELGAPVGRALQYITQCRDYVIVKYLHSQGVNIDIEVLIRALRHSTYNARRYIITNFEGSNAELEAAMRHMDVILTRPDIDAARGRGCII